MDALNSSNTSLKLEIALIENYLIYNNNEPITTITELMRQI